MEQKFIRYIRHHTMPIVIVLLLSFLILFLGEFFLYRKIEYVNKMVAEGLMQIKEAVKSKPLPVVFLKK